MDNLIEQFGTAQATTYDGSSSLGSATLNYVILTINPIKNIGTLKDCSCQAIDGGTGVFGSEIESISNNQIRFTFYGGDYATTFRVHYHFSYYPQN